MSETERDEMDELAGEYVLGTLAPDERAVAIVRLGRDPAFRAAVAAWEARLQPLADAAAPAAAPPNLFDRIIAALPDADRNNVVALRQSLSRWRLGTWGAIAAAACLLAVVVSDRIYPPAPKEYVATLTANGEAPAFVLTVDTVNNTLSIRRVAGDAPADKSYELWAVAPGAAPRSLGVIEKAAYTRALPYAPNDLVFAVSLEPKGGSPTGKPGEVVFSGPLVSAP